MMRALLSLLGLLLTTAAAHATVYYVTPTGTGTGTSWQDATADLNAALFGCEPGDEVWVATGRYRTTEDGDRTVSFAIPAGVRLYGGFAGHETQRDQRQPDLHPTVLTGEIGQPGVQDNAYTVVYIQDGGSDTTLDGFVVSDGCANGMGNPGEPQRCGGGLFNDGSYGQESNPTVRNCRFVNNRARDGGALYNHADGGHASPVLTDCRFEGNHADLDGGAIFNDGRRNGTSSPRLTNCQLVSNDANYGGGMVNYGDRGTSNPTLVDCELSGNRAGVRGGAVFNMGTNGTAQPTLTACVIRDNQAQTGAGVYTMDN